MLRRKIQDVLLTLLVLTTILVGLAWIGLFGLDSTWSNPGDRTCGRISTTRGRFLYQQCNLESPESPPAAGQAGRRQLPANFAVGSNPDGEPTMIECGPDVVRFTFPAPGTFFGLSSKIDAGTAVGGEAAWWIRWDEYTLAYWLPFGLLLLATVAAIIDRLRRGRGPEETGSMAERPAPVAPDISSRSDDGR